MSSSLNWDLCITRRALFSRTFSRDSRFRLCAENGSSGISWTEGICVPRSRTGILNRDRKKSFAE
jgi:hypothetical protein